MQDEKLSARLHGRNHKYTEIHKSVGNSGVRSKLEEKKEETFKPKLNKNTDKYLESRQRRLESRQNMAKNEPVI